MKKKVEIVPINQNDIKSRMLVVRNQAVLLDRDVAALYQVETREVNQAVRNNPEKFPEGFVWELDGAETEALRSKILTLDTNPGRGHHSKHGYKVFTERGLYMLATILKEGELDRKVVYAKFAYTTRHGAIDGKTQIKEVGLYNLDVIISVGYRVKSIQGTRFRQWATRILREMLLNRLEEVREISKLKHRMDAAENDIKQIKGGMNYLVQQLSEPPLEPPRRRIGFGADDKPADKPYAKRC